MAFKVNLVIDQGTTYNLHVELNDDNDNPLSGEHYTPRAKLRKHYASANATTFAATLSNTGTGVLTLSLTAEQTANLQPGKYVYDVEVVDSANSVTRVFEGNALVTPESTK
jgi:hypothetical protein